MSHLAARAVRLVALGAALLAGPATAAAPADAAGRAGAGAPGDAAGDPARTAGSLAPDAARSAGGSAAAPPRAAADAAAAIPPLLAAPPPLTAEQLAADVPPPTAYDRLAGRDVVLPEDHGITGQLVRTVLALTLVIALVVLLGRLLRSRLGRGALPRRGRELAVVERLALDHRHALYLVEVAAGRRLVVGVGDGSVTAVAEVAPEGRPAFGAWMAAGRAPGGSGWPPPPAAAPGSVVGAGPAGPEVAPDEAGGPRAAAG